MSFPSIVLILFSGLGVLHGLFLSVLLWTNAKGNLAYKLLGVLLLILSFRVGKSVFLEFGQAPGINLIFVGLASMLAIGPIFYFYTRSVLDKDFQFKNRDTLHFVPAVVGVLFGFWIQEEWADSVPNLFFVLIYLGYYLHYLVYLLFSFLEIRKHSKKVNDTKSFALLKLVLLGLLAIWVVYVLNLFEESIPYVLGPVLYSIIAYGVTFLVIKKGYIPLNSLPKYSNSTLSDQQVEEIFQKIIDLVVTNKEFSNPDLSLILLSKKLNTSPQSLSLAINKKGGMNFNQFVNFYRIEEAKSIFKMRKSNHLTISSIAFDVGFNSLTSFNGAFKKFVGKTPSEFREGLS